jgi:hypothetical protein
MSPKSLTKPALEITRDIVSEGPMTRADLDEVIRDAIVRGGGDVWKVPDFLAAYTEKNARKRIYKRIEAPLDGFLKIVPNTGCYFHNYKYYNGVEFGRDYTFGHNNKLTQYEDGSQHSIEPHFETSGWKSFGEAKLGVRRCWLGPN